MTSDNSAPRASTNIVISVWPSTAAKQDEQDKGPMREAKWHSRDYCLALSLGNMLSMRSYTDP